MKRIEALAALTQGSNIVCDIGCDHAYTLITAVQKYGVSFGYAVEIASGPLENARRTIETTHLEHQIQPVLSDGFTSLDEPFDTAILAGMGGSLICDILEKGFSKIQGKKLIIEPNCDAYRVREFLCFRGFRILHEEALFDAKKYYEILVFVPGEAKVDAYDISYGPQLRRHPSEVFRLFYKKKRDLLKSILPKIEEENQKREKQILLDELNYILEEKPMEKFFILQTKNYYRTYFIDDQPRPTILVSPGGGYKYTSPRESEPVVEAFQALGYHIVVVNYRETPEDGYPLPQTYLAEAIRQIEKDSRVAFLIGLGFSAGGHCLLEIMLHHQKYQVQKMELLMLGYPVITAESPYAHQDSFINLLKDKASDESLRTYLSLEKEVTKENAIDLFLWGTATDESVSMINSLKLLEAYHKVQGNVEYHLFPLGGHGLSVATTVTKDIPYIHRWIDFAHQWIELKRNQFKK